MAKGRHWVALWLVAFLVTTWLVYARQTAAIHAARELADLRARRANLDGHRADLERRIHAAESRAVLVPRAQARLGLHLPSDPHAQHPARNRAPLAARPGRLVLAWSLRGRVRRRDGPQPSAGANVPGAEAPGARPRPTGPGPAGAGISGGIRPAPAAGGKGGPRGSAAARSRERRGGPRRARRRAGGPRGGRRRRGGRRAGG